MMAPYLFEFRKLFHGLMQHQTADLWGRVLEPWLEANNSILAPYERFRTLGEWGQFNAISDDETCSLYALSRVSDVLLEGFQPGGQTDPHLIVPLEGWKSFWLQLGLRVVPCADFHPFWCEIVAVAEDEDAEARPQIVEELWPALCFGDLLIARAGVKIRAGRHHIRADVAASSPLYFAYRRAYRPAVDLSHGWGSNSQWNTSFRRDYLSHGHYIFNADGIPDFGEPPFLKSMTAQQWADGPARQFFASDDGAGYGLTLEEREELLLNRCLVRTAAKANDFWPYYDTAIWRQDDVRL